MSAHTIATSSKRSVQKRHISVKTD